MENSLNIFAIDLFSILFCDYLVRTISFRGLYVLHIFCSFFYRLFLTKTLEIFLPIFWKLNCTYLCYYTRCKRASRDGNAWFICFTRKQIFFFSTILSLRARNYIIIVWPNGDICICNVKKSRNTKLNKKGKGTDGKGFDNIGWGS